MLEAEAFRLISGHSADVECSRSFTRGLGLAAVVYTPPESTSLVTVKLSHSHAATALKEIPAERDPHVEYPSIQLLDMSSRTSCEETGWRREDRRNSGSCKSSPFAEQIAKVVRGDYCTARVLAGLRGSGSDVGQVLAFGDRRRPRRVCAGLCHDAFRRESDSCTFMPAIMAPTKGSTATGESARDAMAGPGQRPAIPQPMPKRTAPRTRRGS